MTARIALFLALFALSGLASPPIARASNCAGTSTGLVPLTDLGAGFYQGAQGGLYAFGSNHRPDAHNLAGLAIANGLVPLDTLGNPDPVNGRIVLVSIGMSNCTQEFSAFVPRANADPVRNPRVLAIDCALGGQTAILIMNPAAPYWDTVASRLRARGSAPRQVQIVWMKEANAGPRGVFPASKDSLLWSLGSALLTTKSKLPNLKLAYLTSRIYAGYASTSLNPEPYAYESGFAVKELIAAQIAGVDSLEYDSANGPVRAPWIAWGPYLWADGMSPRSDGLTWRCSDFSSNDGTHPSTSGRNLVADSLLAFFRHDETTAPWYLAPGVELDASAPAAASGLALRAGPVPAAGHVEFSLAAPGAWTLDVLDLHGRRVKSWQSDAPGPRTLRWDRLDRNGTCTAPGVYFMRLTASGATLAHRLILR